MIDLPEAAPMAAALHGIFPRKPVENPHNLPG